MLLNSTNIAVDPRLACCNLELPSTTTWFDGAVRRSAMVPALCLLHHRLTTSFSSNETLTVRHNILDLMPDVHGYNTYLRNVSGWQRKYPTTVHLISSNHQVITRATRRDPVYRGLGRNLPDQFTTADELVHRCGDRETVHEVVWCWRPAPGS